MLTHDENEHVEEAHCYVVQCRRIVCGQYVADYSTTECRTFRPKGLRQLRTKLEKKLEKRMNMYWSVCTCMKE